MLTKSCLVVFIGSIVLLSLCGRSFASNDEDDEAYYQMFAKSALEPRGSLKLLYNLLERYQGREDSVSKERLNTLTRLIEMSKFKVSNCNPSYVDEMDQLIEQYGPYQHNLIPYLNANLDEQMEYCVSDWNEISARWKEVLDPYSTHYKEAKEVLKKLKALMKKIEKEPLLKTRKEKIASLIKLSEINEGRCNEETPKAHQSFIKSRASYPDESITHYAIHFYSELSKFCEKKGKGYF